MKSIKDLLNEREISLTKIAKEMGITRQTLNNVAKGNNKPSLITIKKICAYFRVDYKDYI